MPADEVPTIEESTYAIQTQFLALLHRLTPGMGIGVAALPAVVQASLQQLATGTTAGLQDLSAGVTLAAGELAAQRAAGTVIAETLATWPVEGIARDLATIAGAGAPGPALDLSAIEASLAVMQADLHFVTDQKLSDVVAPLYNLGGNVLSVNTTLWQQLMSMNDLLRYGIVDICRELSLWSGASLSVGGSIYNSVTMELENLIRFLGLMMMQIVGEEGIVSGDKTPSLGQGMAQGQIDAVEQLLAHPGGASPGLTGWFNWVVGWAKDTALDLLGLIPGMDKVGEAAFGERMDTGIHSSPNVIFARAGLALAGATLAGTATHGMSGLASAQIFGNLGLNLNYVTAFIGKLTGWDPIINAVIGNFYFAYLNQPCRYYFADKLTPMRPAAADLMRFRTKGIIKDDATFIQEMRYQGFDKGWAQMFIDDMYREPGLGDLMMMADGGEWSDKWLVEKLMKLGYHETDRRRLIPGLRTRLQMKALRKIDGEWLKQVRSGRLLVKEYEPRIREWKLNEPLTLGMINYARELAASARVDEEAKLARERYARDELTLEEFRDTLAVLGFVPDKVRREVTLAELRRYRKVFLMRPTEEALKELPLKREAFLAGRLSGYDYLAALTETGMKPELVDLRRELDGDRRELTVRSEWEKYGLPRLRDDVRHGMITPEQYSSALGAAKFPVEYIGDEVALARAALERRRRGLVRTEQLPAYTRAYTIGLIDRGQCVDVLQEAGIEPAGVEARMLVLDDQRAAFDLRKELEERREAERQEREQVRETETRRRAASTDAKSAVAVIAGEARTQEGAQAVTGAYALGEITGSELRRVLAERDVEAERIEVLVEQAEVLRVAIDTGELTPAALEAALVEQAAPAWAPAVVRIAVRIEREFTSRDVEIPDGVWRLLLQLEDEVKDPRGPRPAEVLKLARWIEEALAIERGVLGVIDEPEPAVSVEA